MSGEAHPLDPRVRSLWHLMWVLGGLPVVLAATVAVLLLAGEGRPALAVVPALVAVGFVVAAVVVPRLRYARFRWRLTDEGLEVSHGVVLRVQSSIPAFRVQQVDVRQGPLERWFGLVQLQITTASSASDGVLPGLAADRADGVRRALLERVALDDGV